MHQESGLAWVTIGVCQDFDLIAQLVVSGDCVGIGLAANQVGMSVRAFAMIRDLENNEVIVCFNPKIVKKYNEVVSCEEGCLSFPDEIINVDRPDKIVVKYEDEDKKEHKIKLSGMASRVFQHEFDHLEGIDFTQR